nr:serrate RNA effector molecule-like [Tanacetum cinerariifolium]
AKHDEPDEWLSEEVSTEEQPAPHFLKFKEDRGVQLDAEAEAFLAGMECTEPLDGPLAITTTTAFQFGYDHPGGYERDMVGRSGYHDDRPPGRFAGRSSGGYQGGPGRDGYNGHANTSREGLMYKQFIQELEDEVLPFEAERSYQEYKSEYISTQKRAYFDAYKGKDWQIRKALEAVSSHCKFKRI